MDLTSVFLKVSPDRLREFFLLLQQGFSLTVRAGCTLQLLLTDQWGVPPDYVSQRITTIFLDGRAIDDVSTAVVRDGSVIALSGAMPGLVGATMRRGGYYAAMRKGISYQETGAPVSEGDGMVRLKLFNLLLPELGPKFLSSGIILEASQLSRFFEEGTEWFWAGCCGVAVNGAAADVRMLQEQNFPCGGKILLAVDAEGG